MKALAIFTTFLFLLVSCNQKKEEKAPLAEADININTTPSMEGSWELVNYYSYDGENIVDTVPMSDGYRQIKIYSGNKVMWSRKVPMDSIEWYGFGTYENTEDELIETLDYGSASMLKIIDTMRVFSFELHLGKNEFTQITVGEEGDRISSENYRRLE